MRPKTAVVLGRDGGLSLPASQRPVYDGPMTAFRRRAADPLVSILAIGLAMLVVGCTSGAAVASPSTSPRPSVDLASVPSGAGGASGGPTAGRTAPSTTDVDGFGTIWDALPASFPKLPGQEPADTGAGPTSGSFVVKMTAAAASAAMKAKLTSAGWAAEAGTPLEDGSIVLEATGASAGCQAEVRFLPTSGTIIMTVLYGAACPAS